MYIHELTLQTDDLDAQRAFYGEVLGLPVVYEGDALVITVGETRLTFTQVSEEWNKRYHFAFNIPENQVDEAIAWIVARTSLLADKQGETRFSSAFTGWDAHNFYFLDAAGNILECIARHTLPNSSDAPFGPDSLLCISEIGIASDDVAAIVETLCQTLGAPVYDGAGSDTFAAVGDEHGLLINVKHGRIWYPDTGIAATFAPVTALLEQDGLRFDLTYPPVKVKQAT